MRQEKSAFDHINTDWNLHEDGSTDFSDDDTMIDERVDSFKLLKSRISFHSLNLLAENTLTTPKFCRW